MNVYSKNECVFCGTYIPIEWMYIQNDIQIFLIFQNDP